MKLILFNPNNLPAAEKKSIRFNQSLLELLVVNPVYGRIYLSSPLVQRFNLAQTSFQLGRNTKGSWFFIPLKTKEGFQITSHQGAHYFVCRPLVNELTQSFPATETFFLQVGKDKLQIEGWDCFKLSRIQSDDLEKAGKSKRSYTTRKKNDDGGVVSKERKAVAQYEQTNFMGRIKTWEIIRAEQRLAAGRIGG